MSTSNKVVVITGASQGIGAGLVKGFRERGYQVVATSRSIKPSSDPDILAVAGDIADPQTAERVIREAVARFGRVDTLVNNAGITKFAKHTDLDALDAEDFLKLGDGKRLGPHQHQNPQTRGVREQFERFQH